MVRSEIQEIMDLWNNNNGALNPDVNPIQKALAAKALSSLNWNGSQMNPGTGAAGNGLLHNWLEKSNNRKCHVIIKVEETNSNLNWQDRFGRWAVGKHENLPLRTKQWVGIRTGN